MNKLSKKLFLDKYHEQIMSYEFRILKKNDILMIEGLSLYQTEKQLSEGLRHYRRNKPRTTNKVKAIEIKKRVVDAKIKINNKNKRLAKEEEKNKKEGIKIIDNILETVDNPQYNEKPLQEQLSDVNKEINKCEDARKLQELRKIKSNITYKIKQEYVADKIQSYGNDVSFAILNALNSIDSNKTTDLNEIKQSRQDLVDLKTMVRTMPHVMDDKFLATIKKIETMLRINNQEIKLLECEMKIKADPILKIKTLMESIALMNSSSEQIKINLIENENNSMENIDKYIADIKETVKMSTIRVNE